MPGLRPVHTEADREWVGWRKELEHRHKLTQDQKEYEEWVRAGKPQVNPVHYGTKTLAKYPVVIKAHGRFAF